jgi:hypothetical protein
MRKWTLHNDSMQPPVNAMAMITVYFDKPPPAQQG